MENDRVNRKDQKLLAHPLAPLLTVLCMTRWAKASCLAGKHREAILSTVWTANPGKSALRIPAVEIALHHLLDYFHPLTSLTAYIMEKPCGQWLVDRFSGLN